MRIIDTHCHTSEVWYEPVESLIEQMDRNGVAGAVLVQMAGQYDNSYQFDCVRRFPGRFASVVLVDTERADAPQQLETLCEQGAKGVRLGAATRSPEDDPLAIWLKADALGMSVSCSGGQRQFASDEFAALVDSLPNLPIVVEHLGAMKGADEGVRNNPTHRRILDLATRPNVTMKMPGLGEFCARLRPVPGGFPFETNGLPLLPLVIEAFGADRLMWGSDYPPVSGREGYRNSLRLLMDQLGDLSESDRAAIFGGTAATLFGFD